MRIEKLSNGKLRCYKFNIDGEATKDLEIIFNSESDLLTFAKNTYDKTNQYIKDHIGNNQIMRIYNIFTYTDDPEVTHYLDELLATSYDVKDLIEFLQYLKDKRLAENEQTNLSS